MYKNLTTYLLMQLDKTCPRCLFKSQHEVQLNVDLINATAYTEGCKLLQALTSNASGHTHAKVSKGGTTGSGAAGAGQGREREKDSREDAHVAKNSHSGNKRAKHGNYQWKPS